MALESQLAEPKATEEITPDAVVVERPGALARLSILFGQLDESGCPGCMRAGFRAAARLNHGRNP